MSLFSLDGSSTETLYIRVTFAHILKGQLTPSPLTQVPGEPANQALEGTEHVQRRGQTLLKPHAAGTFSVRNHSTSQESTAPHLSGFHGGALQGGPGLPVKVTYNFGAFRHGTLRAAHTTLQVPCAAPGPCPLRERGNLHEKYAAYLCPLRPPTRTTRPPCHC